jgi:hypothetical protein
MNRALIVFLGTIFLGAALCLAAENPAVGTWDCTSDDGHGAVLSWTLVINDTSGKLSGSLQMTDVMPLLDPKLEGQTLTFKTFVNPSCTISFKTRIEGRNLSGTFACPEVSGTFKGVRKS